MKLITAVKYHYCGPLRDEGRYVANYQRHQVRLKLFEDNCKQKNCDKQF